MLFNTIKATSNAYAPNIHYGINDGTSGGFLSWINMDIDNGFVLDITPVLTFQVQNEQECAMHCSENSQICKSTNLKEGSSEKVCEVLDGDKHRNYSDYKMEVGTNHYPIEVCK